MPKRDSTPSTPLTALRHGLASRSPAPRAAARRATSRRPLDSERQRAGLDLFKRQNEVLEGVAQGRPLHQTLDLLLRAIEAQSPGMLASILLLDADGIHVRHCAAPSLPESYVRAIDGEPIGPQAGSCGTAAYRRQAVIVEDIAVDPLWDMYRDAALAYGLRACWSTPIFDGQGRVLGTFAMYFRQPARPRKRHRELIDVCTYTAAIAIVQHREAHERMRLNAQFAEAERIAHLGSYEWNPEANKVYRSEELCRIFGVPRESFPPTFEAYLDRVHPDDRDRTRTTIERSVRDRAPFAFEERIVRPDGAVRHLRSQGMWVPGDSDGTVKLVGICQDITDRKAAEDEHRRTVELRIRNEQLKAFAYMVSHDLKAPLRAVIGYARELDQHQGGFGPRAQHCIEQILTGARGLDRLIDDLLEYSRLDADPATTTDVDLSGLIADMVAERRVDIAARGAEVSLRVPALTVRTWARGVHQALANLIDNALKYHADGRPPRVEVTAEQHAKAVRVSVADNGIGFDMRHHDRIFGLFNRLVDSDRVEGTGAGLAIVKKIVDRLGGRVWAESTPGSGATFFVELPANRP